MTIFIAGLISHRHQLRQQVISHRHQLRLRFVEDDTADSMTAELFGEGERWAVPLLTVKTRHWRSYHSPPHPE
jgi:hypothetical protein